MYFKTTFFAQLFLLMLVPHSSWCIRPDQNILAVSQFVQTIKLKELEFIDTKVKVIIEFVEKNSNLIYYLSTNNGCKISGNVDSQIIKRFDGKILMMLEDTDNDEYKRGVNICVSHQVFIFGLIK
ncbi:hypothetical protein ACQ4LE_010959 [Meloidogyne hapla]